MLTALGGLAEFERQLIRAATPEGRRRAVACGVKLGRKPKLTSHQVKEAIKRCDAGESVREMARNLQGQPQHDFEAGEIDLPGARTGGESSTGASRRCRLTICCGRKRGIRAKCRNEGEWLLNGATRVIASPPKGILTDLSARTETGVTNLIDRGFDFGTSLASHESERETDSAPRLPKRARGVSLIYLDEDDQSKPVTTIYKRPRGRRRLVFGWYGGKFSHLDWLLPLLPKCHHYCEPFAGSAAVLINRPAAPVETYNDVDGDVVNFFRNLRDRHDELIRAIALTPFSREEYHLAIYGYEDGIDDLERARRFYIRARQTRTGLAQTASLGRWANCKDTSRAGMSGVVSRWLGGVEALDEIAARLLRVQIENRPAVDVIKLYDSPQTLFYCDPPYLHATRGDSKAYGFEMTESEHRAFATAVNDCKGMVAVSGYDHPLMDELFASDRWVKTIGEDKTIHSTKGTRQEVLWTNFSPPIAKELFE